MTRILEYIWISLVALTLLKYISTTLVAVLLITTFIKGQLIIDHFMDLKEVRLRYRLIPGVWLFTVISFIATAYYLPA